MNLKVAGCSNVEPGEPYWLGEIFDVVDAIQKGFKVYRGDGVWYYGSHRKTGVSWTAREVEP